MKKRIEGLYEQRGIPILDVHDFETNFGQKFIVEKALQKEKVRFYFHVKKNMEDWKLNYPESDYRHQLAAHILEK